MKYYNGRFRLVFSRIDTHREFWLRNGRGKTCLWKEHILGKRIKYYKKPKPLSTTSFEPLSTTTKGGYTTNV